MRKIYLLTFVFLASCYLVKAQNFQISGGNNFSAAVCDNQVVFTWGANTQSQLGIDLNDDPFTEDFRNVPAAVRRGNVSQTAGGLEYGLLPPIRQVDAGSGAHILGLDCDDHVWAWGNGENGQLGRATFATSAVPQRVLRGEQAANPGANDPNGIFLSNIFYVGGGNNSSFGIEIGTGRVLAWGQNTNGQLGVGNTVDQDVPRYVRRSAAEGGGILENIVQVRAGDDCTYALDADGFVWSFGNNNGHKLGRPTAVNINPTAGRVVKGAPLNNGYSATPVPLQFLDNITQISGGDTHCLALDEDGTVWSFGGDWGQGQ
ncbi:MAG: RCC1 domain-containing protein, partial [Cytophagaceae bacterium]